MDQPKEDDGTFYAVPVVMNASLYLMSDYPESKFITKDNNTNQVNYKIVATARGHDLLELGG